MGALGTGSAPYREGAVREERPSGSAFTSPHLSGIPISIISPRDLIRNKEAASQFVIAIARLEAIVEPLRSPCCKTDLSCFLVPFIIQQFLHLFATTESQGRIEPERRPRADEQRHTSSQRFRRYRLSCHYKLIESNALRAACYFGQIGKPHARVTSKPHIGLGFASDSRIRNIKRIWDRRRRPTVGTSACEVSETGGQRPKKLVLVLAQRL